MNIVAVPEDGGFTRASIEEEKGQKLTSALLKAFTDVRTVRTSASFSAGTWSCTLKAAEKPMSSISAAAEVVPATGTLTLFVLDGGLPLMLYLQA